MESNSILSPGKQPKFSIVHRTKEEQEYWTSKMTPYYKVEFDTSVGEILNIAESELTERGNRNVH